MRRALRKVRYDVLHVDQPNGWLAAKSKPPDAVFVHRSHGLALRAERVLSPWRARYGPPQHLANRLVAGLMARHSRLIAAYADGHIVSCRDDAEFLEKELGVPAYRIGLIPQAPPELFTTREAPPMTPERLRRVLYVGQFAFFKAPMIVAATIRQLAETRCDLRFTWLCSRVHHADVRNLLGNTPVDLVDWMDAEKLIDVYDAHGSLLFPSFFEGFGKVFLEAMSRGLCVVSSNVGGARDVIESGVSGVLVPPGNADAFASAVLSLVADPHHAARMSATAASVARTYTWERVARETAAFYASLRRASSPRLQ
jgi:glycosyltransferase involved in cell wall biosynthesis